MAGDNQKFEGTYKWRLYTSACAEQVNPILVLLLSIVAFVVIVGSKGELQEVVYSEHWQISCSIFPKIFGAS